MSGGSLSGRFLSRGLCPGGLCPGEGYLPRGISVWDLYLGSMMEVSVQGGLCPWKTPSP